jgi:hypothetical protein
MDFSGNWSDDGYEETLYWGPDLKIAMRMFGRMTARRPEREKTP